MKNIDTIRLKFKILTQKLKTYGLDPRDWFISELPNGLIVIQNILEKDTTFLGRADFNKTTWDWKDIQLAEI
jgi:hypothetical protein